MQQQNSGMSCQLGSWALAAGIGLLATVLLLIIGDWGWIGAIFMGVVTLAVLGLLFGYLFCRDLPAPRGPGNIDSSGARETSASAPTGSAPAAESAASAAPVSTAVAPESPATSAPAAADAQPDVRTADATTDAEAGSQVKPTTKLEGQDELAARKGEWKYEGDAGSTETSAAEDKSAPVAKEPAAKDYDGDGTVEEENEGTKPETLTEAREGGPDNLKEIKGVGPKLEKLLNSMGFFHFDQIANWTEAEVAWVNANLEGFKGRVSRDGWVEQAKILASGEDTEFSKRVDKGDVY